MAARSSSPATAVGKTAFLMPAELPRSCTGLQVFPWSWLTDAAGIDEVVLPLESVLTPTMPAYTVPSRPMPTDGSLSPALLPGIVETFQVRPPSVVTTTAWL